MTTLPEFKSSLVQPPGKGKKYRAASNFAEYSILFAQSEGFEIKSTSTITPATKVVDLICTTPLCPFRLIADFTTFEGKSSTAGKTGFVTSRDRYQDKHNHSAPFFSLDLEEEEIRRNVSGGTTELPLRIARTEMSEFIAQINPALLKHYEIFNLLGFFDSSVSDLVSGLSERAISDLLSSREAGRLPPFAKAEVAEGIKRCKERIAIDPKDIDGSILRGENRERALRFVENAIAEGSKAMTAAGIA